MEVYEQIDVEDAIKILKKRNSNILFDNERIMMAFKCRAIVISCGFYLTSHRTLLTYNKSLTDDTSFESISYKSIKAFQIKSESRKENHISIKIYCNVGITTSFDCRLRNLDMFSIHKFLSYMVFGNKSDFHPSAASVDPKHSIEVVDQFFDTLLCNDFGTSYMEQNFGSLLLEEEKMELAVKCGSDALYLILKTNLRIIKIRKRKIISVQKECIRNFLIRTAGIFGRESDIFLYTNILQKPIIEMEMKNGICDDYPVYIFITDRLLGTDHLADISAESGSIPLITSLDAFHKKGHYSIGAFTRLFHTTPAILQCCENIEMVFRSGNDFIFFTTHRLMIINGEYWASEIIAFSERLPITTIPWKHIQAFGVYCTSYANEHGEVYIWTDIHDVRVASPGASFYKFDTLSKDTDILSIQQYLAERCLKKNDIDTENITMISKDIISANKEEYEGLKSWIKFDLQEEKFDNYQSFDSTLKRLLTADESIFATVKTVNAFSHNGVVLFTNKRILTLLISASIIDGGIEWISVPYKIIRSYSIESSGFWTGSKLKICCNAFWHQDKFEVEFVKGQVDVIAIENYIFSKILEDSDEKHVLSRNNEQEHTDTFNSVLSWIGDGEIAVNKIDIDNRLRSSISLLEKYEIVHLAHMEDNTLSVFTNKRFLFISKTGLGGDKVKFTSYPLDICIGYRMRSDALKLFLDVHGRDILKLKITDTDEIQRWHKLLGRKFFKL